MFTFEGKLLYKKRVAALREAIVRERPSLPFDDQTRERLANDATCLREELEHLHVRYTFWEKVQQDRLRENSVPFQGRRMTQWSGGHCSSNPKPMHRIRKLEDLVTIQTGIGRWHKADRVLERAALQRLETGEKEHGRVIGWRINAQTPDTCERVRLNTDHVLLTDDGLFNLMARRTIRHKAATWQIEVFYVTETDYPFAVQDNLTNADSVRTITENIKEYAYKHAHRVQENIAGILATERGR